MPLIQLREWDLSHSEMPSGDALELDDALYVLGLTNNLLSI